MDSVAEAVKALDSTVILAALVGLSALALIAALLLHRRASSDIGALAGRLSQMAESQSAAQAHMAENLRQQERILSQAIDARLVDLQKRVSDRLQESAQSTQTTVGQLNERLAVIEAMKMENILTATRDGTVKELLAGKGESLAVDQPILSFA